MADSDDVTKFVPAPALPDVEQVGQCEMVVHGLDGTTPGTTVPAGIYISPRADGRALVQIAPLQPQHRRRFGSWRFIVERAEAPGPRTATKESKR